MRNLGSLTAAIVARSRERMTRQQLIAAHSAAERFHGAFSRALSADFDIEDATQELRRNPQDPHWLGILHKSQATQAEAMKTLGESSLGVPIRWLALMGVEAESNVVPLRPAAE